MLDKSKAAFSFIDELNDTNYFYHSSSKGNDFLCISSYSSRWNKYCIEDGRVFAIYDYDKYECLNDKWCEALLRTYNDYIFNKEITKILE